MKAFLRVLLVGCLLAGPVVADDLFPPSWRGQPGSTWAEWEFSTANPSPLPDRGFNPYGAPTTNVYPGVGQNWWPSLNGRTGVWPLSGEIWTTIPNQPVQNPYKDIQIQLTWEPQAPGNVPIVQTTAPAQVVATLVQQIPLGGTWMHSIYTIRLEPNPASETILVSGGIDVDQLVIDTICVPEPGALLLLALGGLTLVRRRS